ncbi:MAG: hypothetical protein GVY13_12600 [Alphaproteobacteria bacterium]|nr:hypothetical protein [Alphaproteobacteria bacterium]
MFLDGEILRFAALVGAVEVPERFRLSITLSGAAAADRVCARISGRRAIGFRTAETGEAVPVLVVSQGRAGSTAAMCALGAHPDILIRNRFPFETRMMQYFAGLAAMQLRPADLTDPELEALDGPKGPGPNPYYRPDPETVPWMARTAARQAIQHSVASTWSFYAHCAGIQGKADFRAVAEKAPPDPRRIGLVRMLFPDLRLVLLLRDPRDVLASIMAFNEKRGYAAFGREAARDDVDFARSFVKSVEQLAEFRRLAPEATILRYEDLIRTPNESLASVFRSLGLGFGEGLVGGAVAEMLKDRDGRVSGHRTTAMAADSIGRWKSDLQPDIQEIVRNAMRPALEALDYTVA